MDAEIQELYRRHLKCLSIYIDDFGDASYAFYAPETTADEVWFPDPRMGFEEDGFLCAYVPVTPDSVRLAYHYGIFPYFSGKVPRWSAPINRFVLFPEKLHISHSLRTLLNKRRYMVSFNRSFPEVVEACRTIEGRNRLAGAWLTPEIRRVYTLLYEEGIAKSVEVWDREDDRLVGGLYGIYINGCFMGESMFSRVSSGSKLALVGLCEFMKQDGGKLIDLQFETPHLKSMGGEHLPYYYYLTYLNPEAAKKIDAEFRNPIPRQNIISPRENEPPEIPLTIDSPLLDIRTITGDSRE
ncbi:MAG: leucyl/phenylalanyl-tRNA--protein transferase [Muribaculaceae bacterium]|nr:leucyl/phenylalanyl-tRNA--protein transferase [Muribaculaceae bacterium]